MPREIDTIWRLLTMREAIASTALSHEPDCTCAACGAAEGDADAFARFFEQWDGTSQKPE